MIPVPISKMTRSFCDVRISMQVVSPPKVDILGSAEGLDPRVPQNFILFEFSKIFLKKVAKFTRIKVNRAYNINLII